MGAEGSRRIANLARCESEGAGWSSSGFGACSDEYDRLVADCSRAADAASRSRLIRVPYDTGTAARRAAVCATRMSTGTVRIRYRAYRVFRGIGVSSMSIRLSRRVRQSSMAAVIMVARLCLLTTCTSACLAGVISREKDFSCAFLSELLPANETTNNELLVIICLRSLAQRQNGRRRRDCRERRVWESPRGSRRGTMTRTMIR